ncbi:hypothetical protein H6G36_25350 [Anabaena minutissima FACHB-250]|nr:hypothetical protein [Anabaena minutissima FACHB-250]
MVPRKPDPTGQKFGRLTVLRESGRCPKSDRPLFLLQCDCGNTVKRTRNSFDRKQPTTPSCGCYQREIRLAVTASRTKPDPTGQRFGRLIVLGRGSQKPDRNSFRQLWKCQCDCGKVTEITRGCLDGGQISCGCAKRDVPGRPITDIAGLRFGTLQAIKLTGKKDKNNQPTWLLQCDCGNLCEMSLKSMRLKKFKGIRINCRDRTKHPEHWLHYPPTPSPYPKEAGELLSKYLPLTEIDYQQIDSAVEDEKRDRLLRAAWILTYRRSQGEQLSELYEKHFIQKHLRYCSIDVFWQRKLEAQGGFLYTASNSRKQIGDAMTNLTPLDYPEIELDLRGQNFISADNSKPTKRVKFRRC